MNNKGPLKLYIIGAVLGLGVLLVTAWLWSANTDRTNSVPQSKTVPGHVFPATATRTLAIANAISHNLGQRTTIPRTPQTYYTTQTFTSIAPVAPISETVNDYAVTLYPAYVNVNRIVLTYTVESSQVDLRTHSPFVPLPSEAEEDYKPQLTNEQGHEFPLLGSGGVPRTFAGASLAFDFEREPGDLPSVLKLHLTLNNAEVWFVDKAGGATVRGVKGPFNFDFSLPVDPVRRVAEVQQTATTRDGGTITIEKVIVTRQDARVVWRVTQPSDDRNTPTNVRRPNEWWACCSLELDSGDKIYQPHTGSGTLNKGDVVNTRLIDKQGEWAISTWYNSTWPGDAYFPPEAGPVFYFTVSPPITSSKGP